MRDEQDQAVAVLRGRHGGPLLVTLDRQGGGHAGQDDDVVELQDGKEFGGQFWHVQSLWPAVGTIGSWVSGACYTRRRVFRIRAPDA